MAGMLGEGGDRLERLVLLPHPRGALASEGRGSVMSPGINWADWIAPEWVAQLAAAAQAPRAAAAGADVDPRDAMGVALASMGGGMLSGPGIGLGMNTGPKQLRLPLRRAASKGPIAYHGSYESRKPIVPDPERGIETRGAAFLASNEDVAYSFTVPREYGEPVFYSPSGRELSPGVVSRIRLDLKRPKELVDAEAQKFIDDTGYQGQLVEQAKREGYDSVVARNVLEGIGERYRGDVYAVFNKRSMALAPTRKR